MPLTVLHAPGTSSEECYVVPMHPEQHQQFAALCSRQGADPALVIRDLIDQYIHADGDPLLPASRVEALTVWMNSRMV